MKIGDKETWKSLSQPMRDLIEARTQWLQLARPLQLPPKDDDWLYWLLKGGRGSGKTRTGAEDAGFWGGTHPGARIAVVAATAADARDTCIEGHSGLLSVLPKSCIKNWNRSLGELILFNDARFKTFSAEEPDRLRGPQHHRAWCDELAAWRYEDAWDQMLFGLRLGDHPQVVITTTPRPTKLIKQIISDPRSRVVTESTFSNQRNLPDVVLAKFQERYAGTRLGRQELDAEVLDDVAGSLWTRRQLDEHRRKLADIPEMTRVVVGIDPATAEPGREEEARAETGIIAAGLGVDGRGYLLGDYSCRLSPEGWARRAISAMDEHDASALVAETNQGGAMVTSTIRAVRANAKVITVHAAKGKVTRAEPISALYEQGRISHVGSFPQLEDQMVAFTSFGIEGDTTGDRVDALVWAFSQLFPRLTKKANVGPLKIETTKEYHPHNF